MKVECDLVAAAAPGSGVQQLRARVGRPHWMILDEAHHFVPVVRESGIQAISNCLTNTMLITVDPDHLPDAVLASIDTVAALGNEPNEILGRFCSAAGLECPPLKPVKLERGTAIFWSRKQEREPLLFSPLLPAKLRKFDAAENISARK